MCMEKYYKEEKDLLKEMGHPFGTYQTIDMWISELLVECLGLRENPNKSGIFDDVLGVLSRDFGIKEGDDEFKNSFRSKAFRIVSKNMDNQYDEYLRDYAVSENINGCGDYYKKIIAEDPEATRCLKKLLENYSQNLAPLVYGTAVTFLINYSRDEEGAGIFVYDFSVAKEEAAKSAFDKYIGKYESLLRSI